MAAGLLGKANLSATTITNIYTVPASTVATCNILVCNRNSSAVVVRLALSASAGVQATDEFIEYDITIPANGVLERTAIMLQAAKIVTAYSDTANVTVIVDGFEEAA
jgi:hypothetical protein